MALLLPSQFPCLVKAVFSFAGESKGDLGFVQGDLIECLNPGDGQWWFGRLKRNKTMGVFPSNYVELVDERPGSNASSSNSRPSSSRSESRPNSRISLKSFRSYGHGLNAEHRPSSSSGRKTQLPSPRSMTSLNHYDEPQLPSAGAPSASQAAFYQYRNHYDDDQETFEDVSPYTEEELDGDGVNGYGEPHFESGPRGSAALSSVVRQTPSPLRWAMQDLMESLDTMRPPNRFPPSPREAWAAREYSQYEIELSDTWVHPESRLKGQFPEFGPSDCPYPEDMRPPPLLNYVDKMQAKLDRFNNSQYAPHRENFNPVLDGSRPQSRLSNSSDFRPRSSHSVNKPLPQPPMPPPHSHRRQDTSSTTSHSTKYSIFSAGASDYSSASSASAGSAGSAGSFARKKARQRQAAEEAASERSALTVLPKSQSNVLGLKRRKSYGSSLKKTIGKLLNTSPTKPPPGTVTDHGDKIIEWQNVRRDVNRANTPSSQEREEHRERLEMSEGIELIRPIEILERIIEGDESANGSPILPDETFDITKVNFSLIDRATRLVNQIPPQYLTSPAALAKAVICRPYASEIQRLRAIFVFLAEKFTWEPLQTGEALDSRQDGICLQKFLETRRGTSEEIAWCFWEMCQGCNIHAQVISGHLKSPSHDADITITPQQNHYWNAVIVNGEWRMVDASLASPTHPSRPPPVTKSFEPFYFLTRPSEFLYTHVPLLDHRHQHVVSQEIIYPAIQLALPYACAAFFQNDITLESDFDVGQTRLEGFQVACIDIEIPEDVECVAEVESQAYARDLEGDLFESGDTIREQALAQPLWLDGGQRRVYRVKGFLSGEGARGALKIYAGKKGLMTSALDNPHRLALSIPLSQFGSNPPFRFLTRHPTPHAQRHDLYIRQPQCRELRINQTFIFSVLQNPSTHSAAETAKPAKLAIQSPSGKIIKLSNRVESEDGAWEALIKCGERGSWKGIVVGATARWCVFAEWECL